MLDTALPPELAAYYDKALAAFTKEHYEYAAQLFGQVLAAQPTMPEARQYYHLALQRQAKTQPPGAGGWLAGGWFAALGWLQALSGHHQQALEAYTQAVQRQPLQAGWTMGVAQALAGAGADQAAVKTYEAVLELKPGHLLALRALASLYIKQRALVEARKCYETILKRHPHDAAAAKGLKHLDAVTTRVAEWPSGGVAK